MSSMKEGNGLHHSARNATEDSCSKLVLRAAKFRNDTQPIRSKHNLPQFNNHLLPAPSAHLRKHTSWRVDRLYTRYVLFTMDLHKGQRVWIPTQENSLASSPPTESCALGQAMVDCNEQMLLFPSSLLSKHLPDTLDLTDSNLSGEWIWEAVNLQQCTVHHP